MPHTTAHATVTTMVTTTTKNILFSFLLTTLGFTTIIGKNYFEQLNLKEDASVSVIDARCSSKKLCQKKTAICKRLSSLVALRSLSKSQLLNASLAEQKNAELYFAVATNDCKKAEKLFAEGLSLNAVVVAPQGKMSLIELALLLENRCMINSLVRWGADTKKLSPKQQKSLTKILRQK